MREDIRTDDSIIYRKNLTFSQVTVRLVKLGADYSITVWGGAKPHIGCTVLAIPRPSLTGDGSRSATASVLNVTGHKDEQICRYLAEKTAKRTGSVVVCTGGFHIDDATEDQIREVMKAVAEIEEEMWEN